MFWLKNNKMKFSIMHTYLEACLATFVGRTSSGIEQAVHLSPYQLKECMCVSAWKKLWLFVSADFVTSAHIDYLVKF